MHEAPLQVTFMKWVIYSRLPLSFYNPCGKKDFKEQNFQIEKNDLKF
jgi:hypothetical protein